MKTLGTEQYRGDWGFLRQAACEGSQRVFTQTIYSKVAWFVGFAEGLAMFGQQNMFWVPNHRSHNALQEQQQGEHWPEKFLWQLTVWDRGFPGLGYRSGCHYDWKWKVKKGSPGTNKCVIFGSHECWIFSSFLNNFWVCFHVRCAHLTEWRHMLIHTNV